MTVLLNKETVVNFLGTSRLKPLLASSSVFLPLKRKRNQCLSKIKKGKSSTFS